MPEPCRSCERREIDWGGCRCQAFALTGEAGTVDPACALSPEHAAMQALATTESAKAGTGFRYRTRKAGAAVKQVKEGIEGRSEEHTSELQSLMRISYAVFCLKKKTT